MRTPPGLSHATLAQCEPRIDARPAAAVRREWRASRAFALETATTLGLAHLGVPSSSESLASLCGVATQQGGGHTHDAARIALRLPAWCGGPTREAAAQVREVSVARPQESPGPFLALTTQRHAVLGHPERLERLSRHQGDPQGERLPRPNNRSNDQETIYISNGYEEYQGPPLRTSGGRHFLENAGPPGRRETALTSCIQKLVNRQKPI
jgi:hypothetical protein